MAMLHSLKATVDTVTWGYFDNSLKPALTARPGDLVEIETLAHHAGAAPDLMMDDGVRAVYEGIPADKRGPGVHIVTGPIYVEGLKAGDVLEVKVLDMWPRLPYGCNVCTQKGLLCDDFVDKHAHGVIYKADVESRLARAEFQLNLWTLGNYKSGVVVEPGQVKREKALGNVYVPLRPHFGTAGVAPKANGKISTVAPGSFGGNMDNRNFIPGAAMLYVAQVDGGLFTAGDSHLAQGDGEISGTAIEGHVNALIQFNIRKDVKLIENPVLITPTHYHVHGMHEDLDEAMRQCGREAVEFLRANKGLSREEAYSLLSVSCDFQVSQAVNTVKGVHCKISRSMFVPAVS